MIRLKTSLLMNVERALCTVLDSNILVLIIELSKEITLITGIIADSFQNRQGNSGYVVLLPARYDLNELRYRATPF